MRVTSASARHVLLRLAEPASLPAALLAELREEVVLAGWMRASGVLHDVVLRTIGGTSVRKLSGAVHVVALEGSVGLSQGDVTCGLRAVLARETDSGLETLAGELVVARIDVLEVLVTAFDDVTATRPAGLAGVWQVEGAAAPAPSAPAARPVESPAQSPAPSAPVAPPVTRAAPPIEPAAPPTPKPSPTFSAPAVMPRPVVRPKVEEEEATYPDAGDVVEHFAFGRCEVVKSDGDRLHLRLGKDGRVKEIALEMLRVTPLPPAEDAPNQGMARHFKLDRKL
jgi:predicted DNA-binding protein with PD1-like motif